MSYRRQRLESSLQQTIGEVLARRINDPRIRGMVSITAVRVSPDLDTAIVHVSVMPAGHGPDTIHGLRHAAGYIQRLAGEALRSRAMPKLDFRLDESLKTQAAVLDEIDHAMEDTDRAPDEPNPGGEPPPPDPGEEPRP